MDGRVSQQKVATSIPSGTFGFGLICQPLLHRHATSFWSRVYLGEDDPDLGEVVSLRLDNTNFQKILETSFLDVSVGGRISGTFAPERYLSEMRKILLPAEAGKLVRRDRRTIIDWVKRRGCPARTLPSGQYILFEDEFLAWLKEQGVLV